MNGTEIRLLGPLEAIRDGQTVVLGGVKQRAALALLALNAGRVVSADGLVDALWDEQPPPTAATALQGHVSRLRRLLGSEAIVTRPPGYLLELKDGGTDLGRFELLVARGGGETAEERAETLREALALWRGPAIADLAGERGLADEARRLDELGLGAREQLFDVELALGRHVELVSELEAFARDEPYRERPVGQLMLALYRGGRQADALDVYRRFRQQLSETLGLEPAAPLRELERRMLAHDPALAPPAAAARQDGLLITTAAERRLPLTAVAIAYTAVADGQAEPDAEAFAQVAARAREAIRLALERHGASVRRGVGSRLIGLFGDPVPHEDDALRGLLAARAGLAAVDDAAAEAERRFGIQLDARSGIASGESFGGESPAVDLALELCAGALPGEIAVDDTTRAAARGREFRLDRPLVGRDGERHDLHAAFARAVGEERGVGMTLVGPAGIGKSRLAADLLGSLGGDTRVAMARCLSYGDGIALWPAVELVRAGAGLSPGASERAARVRLRSLVGDGDRAAGAVDQLLALLGLSDDAVPDDELPWAVRRLFEGLARRQPVVVYVDDLHWAAPPVIDVVAQLAQSGAPVFVLATARTAPATPIGKTIELGPLDPAACAAVVAGLLGAERIEDEVLAPLVQASDGNPFFLEELVRDLLGSGRLRKAAGGWALEGSGSSLPRSIQTLLTERLDQLPDVQRDVLVCASVLGRSFARLALVHLLDADIDESLESLVAAQLMQETTAEDVDFEFRHLLIRDAAYAMLPLERRAELHERVVQWIDDTHVTAPLAREAIAVYHLDQAHRSLAAFAPGDSRVAEKAASLAARAAALGRVLLGRGDAAAAVALLARAWELDPRDPDVSVELGRAQLDVGDFAAAEAAFVAAEGSATAHRAQLGRLEVSLRVDPTSDLEAAQRTIDALYESFERDGDSAGRAEALAARAYVQLARGRAGELDETLGAALRHARASGDHQAETSLLFLYCSVCWYGPLPIEQGIARCEGVLADAKQRPNVEAAALQALAVLHALSGEFDVARELVGSSRAIRRDVGQLVGVAASAIDEGIVELLAGDFAAAERVLHEGYAALELLGEKGYFSTLATLMAESVAAQGRIGEARELARAAASAASADDIASQVGWRATEARALAAEGATAEAERVAREATALAETTDFFLLRAEAWTALADVLGERGAEARRTAAGVLEAKGCAPAVIAVWTRSGA